MMTFVEAMRRQFGRVPDHAAWMRRFLADRDERFSEGNDKTWGVGNWVRCDVCLDTLGYPAYHHKEHHS